MTNAPERDTISTTAPPTRTSAAGRSAFLSLLFIIVYGGCNWITSQRSDVGTWYYEFERHIPFIPLMIVPYISIDLFFVTAPFLCQTRAELDTLTRRISFSIVVAGLCFLLIPFHMGMACPETSGWTGAVFRFLHGFDQPYNLVPSLHITLLLILANCYARHTRGALRFACITWFLLIGISTLVTYQHQVVDVIGGLILAVVCFYIFRETTWHSVIPNYRVGGYYVAAALACLILTASWRPWTYILLWPAISLGITACGYFKLGPAIYRKHAGQIPLSARLLLAPTLIGQFLSLCYYRRQCNPWNAVTPNVWIGAKLNKREASQAKRQGVTAVLDLTAEFSENPVFLGLIYRNLPVLDLTEVPNRALLEAVSFIEQHADNGVVYVHCKIGYSRTAAVVGAYLLASGCAKTVEQALAIQRQTRPTMVFRPEVTAALEKFCATSSSHEQASHSRAIRVE